MTKEKTIISPEQHIANVIWQLESVERNIEARGINLPEITLELFRTLRLNLDTLIGGQ